MSEAVKRQPDALMSVRGITKSFGSNAVLKGIDLSIHPGEVVALIGSKLLIQLVGFPYGIVVEPVLTEVRRDSQQPCLFMRSVFKNRVGLEVLDKRILKDVLGIAHVVQV